MPYQMITVQTTLGVSLPERRRISRQIQRLGGLHWPHDTDVSKVCEELSKCPGVTKVWLTLVVETRTGLWIAGNRKAPCK